MDPEIEAVPMGRPERLLRRTAATFLPVLSSYTGVFGSGRAALYWACRGLSLPSGTRAWLPSFHCGAEVQAVLDAGFEVAFYRISPDLSIDEDDLARKLQSQPGIVVAIHYFGFPQPGIARLAQLCRGLGCVLIEDCAHSLFSRYQGRGLGEFAPISIFSLRKSLPVFDGGALQVHAALLAAVREQPFLTPAGLTNAVEPYRLCFQSLVKRLIGARLTSVYRRVRNRNTSNDYRLAAKKPAYHAAMSWLSRRLAAIAEPAGIAARRRTVYAGLDARLDSVPGYRKVFDSLEPGVCPLVLPLWVEKRNIVMRALRDGGIHAYRFGSRSHGTLDPEAFPETERLRGNILCVPVHQDMEEHHLDRVSSLLAPLLEHNLHGRFRAVRK